MTIAAKTKNILIGSATLILLLTGLIIGAWLSGALYYEDTTVLEVIEVPIPKLAKNRISRGLHYAFTNQKDFYEQAYVDVDQKDHRSGQIGGLLVNHHLLAPHLIAEALEQVASTKVRPVILIAPDHFMRGAGQVTTTDYDWRTPYGDLWADQDMVDDMADHDLIAIDGDPFKGEHGISNIVGFIKRSMPNATVVPLIVKDSLSYGEVDAMIYSLSKELPDDALVIGSFDFSHETTDLVADFHDANSVELLRTMQFDNLDRTHIDSRPGLYLFLRLVQELNRPRFNLLAQSNSAKIIGDPARTDVTSYITGYFTKGQPQKPQSVAFSAFGDMMLDRFIRVTMDKYGLDHPIEQMRRVMWGSDLTLVNLEGTITDYPPMALDPDSLIFTFDPSVVDMIKRNDINLLNLANNHSDNFGVDGFAQTKENLDSAGIDYFGDYNNQDEISIVKKVRGRAIGFVGYNQLGNRDHQVIVDEIKRLRSIVDHVVVYTHWGNEYQTVQSRTQTEQAHAFVDAGADMVIGTHPHVIQPMEVYQNRLIFYSLGNFIFDQNFSDDVKRGLGIGIVMNDYMTEVYLFPHILHSTFQIRLIDHDQAVEFYESFADKATADQSIKADMKDGHFKVLR